MAVKASEPGWRQPHQSSGTLSERGASLARVREPGEESGRAERRALIVDDREIQPAGQGARGDFRDVQSRHARSESDGAVRDDLVRELRDGIDLVLGFEDQESNCPGAFDKNNDGSVTVEEVVAAVSAAGAVSRKSRAACDPSGAR